MNLAATLGEAPLEIPSELRLSLDWDQGAQMGSTSVTSRVLSRKGPMRTRTDCCGRTSLKEGTSPTPLLTSSSKSRGG